MKIIYFVSLMMILTVTTSTFSQENTEKWFGIYLLPKSVKPNELANLDLKKLKPVGEPLIHQHDIYSYNQDSHEFTLYYENAEKLTKLEPKIRNRPFAVFVGEEAIYVGAFWTSISSQSFDGVIINLAPLNKLPTVFALEAGYPTEKFFEGKDLRSDPRILKAFEEVGKLYEHFEITGKCKSIEPTHKHLPSDIFNFEIVSVLKSSWDTKEISFEINYIREGSKLIEALRKDGEPLNNQTLRDFDKDKELILRFEKIVCQPNPKYTCLK
jgi:hypothetical protein